MNNEEFLRKKIQDAFIIKSKDGIDPQTFYESISNQMSYFLNRVPGFASANVSRGLRGILTEENRNAIETAITNIYLNYISKNKVLKNGYDIAIKDKLSSFANINEIRQSIFRDEKAVMRMCQVSVKDALNEAMKRQSKTSTYLKETATKRSSPANNVTTVQTLASAQNLIKNMRDYSKAFGYDIIDSTVTLQKDLNKGTKRKNGIYAGNGMIGIQNIGMSNRNEKKCTRRFNSYDGTS